MDLSFLIIGLVTLYYVFYSKRYFDTWLLIGCLASAFCKSVDIYGIGINCCLLLFMIIYATKELFGVYLRDIVYILIIQIVYLYIMLYEITHSTIINPIVFLLILTPFLFVCKQSKMMWFACINILISGLINGVILLPKLKYVNVIPYELVGLVIVACLVTYLTKKIAIRVFAIKRKVGEKI